MNIKQENKFENFSKAVTSIKAIAIIGVILFHFNNALLNRSCSEYGILVFCAFFELAVVGVDILVILSGMLLTISFIKKEKNISWKKWYKRRIMRIYPLFIIVELSLIIYNIVVMNLNYDINSILVHLSGLQSIPTSPLFFNVSSVMWYITFILSCYLLFPILNFLIRKNLSITVIIGLLLYILFVIFGLPIYDFLRTIISRVLKRDLENIQYIFYIPRYFDFFFGMVLGFWIENKGIYNLNKLKNKKPELISLIFLIVNYSICYFLYFYQFYPDKIIPGYEIFFLIKALFYPLIAFSLIFFLIFFLNNKPRINQIFECPGNKSYEIYLIHIFALSLISITIFKLLFPINAAFILLLALLIILLSILLSIPIHFLDGWISKEKKIHPIFLTIIFSLICYAIIYYFIYKFVDFNDTFSIVLFFVILMISTAFIVFLKALSLNKDKI